MIEACRGILGVNPWTARFFIREVIPDWASLPAANHNNTHTGDLFATTIGYDLRLALYPKRRMI